MKIDHLHDWNVTPGQAVAIQQELSKRIIYDRPLDLNSIRLVAGVDVSVKDNISQAAVVVVSFPEMKIVETSLSRQPTPFPYIPGLLSFREGPVLEEAFMKLQHEPDVLMFDGMGRAHPRRIGIASHMGLLLQKPTIGCGKSLLTGHFQEPPNMRGAYVELIDRGEVIGAIVRTRIRVKPMFISVGHLIDLENAIKIVMRCTTKFRLPDPIRMAHNAAGTL